MAELSKIRKNGVDYDIKDAAARKAIEDLKIPESGVTDEKIASAVEDYFAENHVTGGGLSTTATTLLISVLRNAVYSTDQSANIEALKTALGSSGGSGGGTGGDNTGGDAGGDTGGGEATTYTVVNALSNVTTSNNANSVASGSSYFATLTAFDGFTIQEVTILMGNKDITNTAYNNGVINIESVTGNIVITASAVSVNVKTLNDYDYSELADYYTCTFNGEGVYPSITIQNPSAMWAAWTVEDEYLSELLSNETITLIAAHDEYGFNGGNTSTKISGGGTYAISPIAKETIYTDDAGNIYSYITWSIEDIKAAINANKTCKMAFFAAIDKAASYHGVFGMILHNVPNGVVTQEMLLNTIGGV